MCKSWWWRAMFGLCSVAALAGSGTAYAGEQAERALALVKQLIASGEVHRDAAIKVAFKAGNIAALLGPDLELQKEWEQRSGIVINARIIPQQAAVANLKALPDIDLTVARTHEFPDLLEQELVADLTPLLKEYNFQIEGAPPQGFVRPRLQGFFGGKVVAIPADGDVLIFYLRRDLLEDPAEKASFRKAYGRELGVPKTWQEYDQLVRFFHRPEKGLYGTAEERDPSGAWMFWLPRYFGQGVPHRKLFDDNLKPLIDSPAGVEATRSYLRTVPYSPPEILADGKDYSYTFPLFMQGRVFAIAGTIAAAKLFNSRASAVRGKFMAIPIPGHRRGQGFVRHSLPIYGNNLVISSHAPQRKLAFLFTMWLTDPDNSVRTVGVPGGFTDPYRWHHLTDARIKDLYTPQALEVFRSEWLVALPPGTGLPGDGEYLDVLDRNLWLAARGQITAEESMRRTAQEWEKLTQQRGRDRQLPWLKSFYAGFSAGEPGKPPAR
ncbi:MAG: extracellular solute-binding protein [Betaproteobacteria bacterium]|nr:extracellular solute-binding protein [Betaproteobacteria bacterium]